MKSAVCPEDEACLPTSITITWHICPPAILAVFAVAQSSVCIFAIIRSRTAGRYRKKPERAAIFNCWCHALILKKRSRACTLANHSMYWLGISTLLSSSTLCPVLRHANVLNNCSLMHFHLSHMAMRRYTQKLAKTKTLK